MYDAMKFSKTEMMDTPQEKFWKDEIGEVYIATNTFTPEEHDALYLDMYGIEYTKLAEVFLMGVPKDTSILEVGCNVGNILLVLKSLGFTNLSGIELNPKAVEIARQRLPDAAISVGNALQIEKADNSYDLVFTSGVLIHIAPENVEQAIKEIHRVSKKFIWGLEYYAEELTTIHYHGNTDRLWKRDFVSLFTSLFPSLKVLKKAIFPYRTEKIEDCMFLFEKR